MADLKLGPGSPGNGWVSGQPLGPFGSLTTYMPRPSPGSWAAYLSNVQGLFPGREAMLWTLALTPLTCCVTPDRPWTFWNPVFRSLVGLTDGVIPQDLFSASKSLKNVFLPLGGGGGGVGLHLSLPPPSFSGGTCFPNKAFIPDSTYIPLPLRHSCKLPGEIPNLLGIPESRLLPPCSCFRHTTCRTDLN